MGGPINSDGRTSVLCAPDDEELPSSNKVKWVNTFMTNRISSYRTRIMTDIMEFPHMHYDGRIWSYRTRIMTDRIWSYRTRIMTDRISSYRTRIMTDRISSYRTLHTHYDG